MEPEQGESGADAPPRRRRRSKRGGRKPRVRHHVNPLGFVQAAPLPTLAQLFARPDLPLEVDVGSMHGEFVLELAERDPGGNFLGLEIRAPLVDEVMQRARRRGLPNVAAVLCNANEAFARLFAPGSLRAVYVHFPDPWFKNRHRKRRLVTREFLDDVARALAPGGVFRFLSDVESYAALVRALVEAHPAFEGASPQGALEVPDEGRVLTNREAWHLRRGDPIHRWRWRRRA